MRALLQDCSGLLLCHAPHCSYAVLSLALVIALVQCSGIRKEQEDRKLVGHKTQRGKEKSE
jgi:hypothetical protein